MIMLLVFVVGCICGSAVTAFVYGRTGKKVTAKRGEYRWYTDEEAKLERDLMNEHAERRRMPIKP